MNSPEVLKKHDIASLQTLYRESESADNLLFPEMRSNILLISGDHYNNRRHNHFQRRIRDNQELNETQKLRLTKNHVQNIHKKFVNNIISLAPGVGFEPKNEGELQDLKSAELHHAVWMDGCDRYDIQEKTDTWCDDFLGIGEVHTKIFWDPTAGDIKAYNQKIDPATGTPIHVDMQGQETPLPADPLTGQPHEMVPDHQSPVYSGQFVFKDIYGFNLLRSPGCRTLEASPYLIERYMAHKDELLGKFPDKEKFIIPSTDETFIVFDTDKGGYRQTKHEVLVREYYFRACPQFPRGYFYITTKDGILHEDELPGGIFPIISQPCEKQQTMPRGHSPVKQMRPYQAEINRASSKMAEHQITLGDDKLVIPNGAKITAGASLPGIRVYNSTGAIPTVVEGRDGSQYLPTIQANITELYQVMSVNEDGEEAATGQMDPYALLFRAASQKKKFNRLARRFERFLRNVALTYIKLAKIHLPEDMLIYAIGKKEQVNIPEFKNSTDVCYQVKLVSQSDDIETKMGKQLILNHALQYTAGKMEKEDIGKLMRAMPYADFDESFSDLTLDYDSVTNDILALDRGQAPQIDETDNHVYAVKRASARMRQSDFTTLSPEIQQAYSQYKQAHTQWNVQIQQQLKMAESEMIPTGGYLVKADFYVADPKDPNARPQRAEVPYLAMQWLIEKLQSQGQGQEQLAKMSQGDQAQQAGMFLQQQAGMPQGMGPPGQSQGAMNAPGRPGNGPPGLIHAAALSRRG